ncbi:MAG: YbaN family protein [Eubacterium sp.]|nr:YbaN family protein [Eubacterium sp.]
MKDNKISRAFWIVLGSICLGLGSIGIFIPVLPTVPFYLATVFCYAKGSQKLHDWFVGTQLYHKHLESFVKHEGMTFRTKLTIMISVTIVMGLGFYFMSRVPVARMILVVVWVCHVIAFVFFIKTKKEEDPH